MPSNRITINEVFNAFENELRNVCITSSKMMSDDLNSVLFSTGKRIRPRLALLCARLGRVKLSQIVPIMITLELAHNASLMHDDVIDNAHVRHGIPTINAARNNKLAILTGDYLLGMIVEYAERYVKRALLGSIKQNINRSKLDYSFRINSISRLICEMCIGEYMQQETAYSVKQQTLGHYFKRVELKTAVFMQYCCIAGGTAGYLNEENVQALGRMGHALGMAFQITDDILDYQDFANIGKTIGQDFMCGVYNLPMICAITKTYDDEMIRLAEKRDMTRSEADTLIKFVIDHDGIKEAVKYRDTYTEKALDELKLFQSNERLDELSAFVKSLAARTY